MGTLRDVSCQDEDLRCHCPRLRRSRRPGRPRIQGLRRIRRQQLRGPMETDHQPRPHCGQGGGLCLSPLRRHGPQDPASRNQPRHQLKKNGIPLPCLPVPGLPISVGSCKYDANDLLALIPAEDCKTFAPAGQACALPLNPGFYGDKDPNGSKSLVLPEIPAIIKPFLSGKIAVEAKAMLDDGTEYLCIQNTLEVVTH